MVALIVHAILGIAVIVFIVKTNPAIFKRVPAGPQLYGSLWEFRGMAFSPDGQVIAYNSLEREATAAGEHFWVRLMDRDGTNEGYDLPPIEVV